MSVYVQAKQVTNLLLMATVLYEINTLDEIGD